MKSVIKKSLPVLPVVLILLVTISMGCYPSKKRTRIIHCTFQILEENKDGYKNEKNREKFLESVNKKRDRQRKKK